MVKIVLFASKASLNEFKKLSRDFSSKENGNEIRRLRKLPTQSQLIEKFNYGLVYSSIVGIE